MKTIDVTPTWSALLPLLLVVYKQSKDPKAIKEMTQEFKNMAQAADKYNELINTTNGKKI
jgi:hypothetical protein